MMRRPTWPAYGLTDAQVPEWLACPHLTRGYRLGGTHASCLLSLFALHNETLNAWTMIAANALSLAALAHALAVVSPAPVSTKAPFVLLWASSTVHLPFSVGNHLFSPMSAASQSLWRKLDVAFIFVASTLLVPALGAFVLPGPAIAALTALALAVTAEAVRRLALLEEGERLDRASHLRLLGCAVAAYLCPVAYSAWSDARAVATAVGIATCLSVGAFAYATSLPERWRPGVFDLVGSSHQVMHVAIAAAHVLEHAFVLDAYRRLAVA